MTTPVTILLFPEQAAAQTRTTLQNGRKTETEFVEENLKQFTLASIVFCYRSCFTQHEITLSSHSVFFLSSLRLLEAAILIDTEKQTFFYPNSTIIRND